ncbi:hypothetical protein BD779DRAFT_1563870 [Infundibulicybe gibba]|nr:hypothetical protein BD779DRAFT_1563870 [Infundibulicybe gibba]
MNSSYVDSLPANQRALFEYTMSGLDANFAPPFLFGSPRYSAWYAVGLLARNEGDDVEVASNIFRQVISCQYTNPSDLWFGTFKTDPGSPDPGVVYPPQAYVSYDLNQALFVCTSWIIVMEEFQHLLTLPCMYNATIGDGYRVGGLDQIISPARYMRVMAATYVGNMLSDSNMTFWGNEWARQAIIEFDRFSTLSEFNSPTYAGVSLYALSLWGYMPKNSTIASRAPDIITKIWTSVGQFYNPTLRTLGGPWDRAYGFDMRSYFAILGAQITGIMGGLADGTAPLPHPLIGSEHYGDAAVVALTPLVSKFHDHLVSPAVRAQLSGLSGSHSYSAHAVSPPFENPKFPRAYTSWTAPGLSVGGIQVDGNVVGGAAINPEQFAPAVILWDTGDSKVGWISHYSTSRTISAVASPGKLSISYPPSSAFPHLPPSPGSNAMTFLISGFRGVSLGEDLLKNGTALFPGLQCSVSGTATSVGLRTISYGDGTLNDLPYYNLTYTLPENFTGVPEIVFSLKKT